MSILIQQDAYSIGKIANGGYSPIEHLAKTAALSRMPWQEVQFAMFTAAFDASGTVHDQRHLVVAGFVASADDWILFDREWKKRLKQDGISYFHRVDCENNKQEFANWSGKDRAKERLLFDLISIIQSHTYRKFACMITNEIVESEMSPEIKAKFHLHAYAFAGIVSISQVYKWAHGELIKTPIEWIFEDGDDGKGELMQCMELFGFPPPDFRPKIDTQDKIGNIRPAFTGLQAADFLAYELFQLMKQLNRESKKPPSPYLERFDEQIGAVHPLTVKSVQEFDQFFKCIENLDEFVARLSS